LGGPSGRDFIEQIRTSADIVSIINGYAPLRKSGKRYKTLCPFHSEKTPSFMVDPEKQLFHCFGCGVGGDVFKFIMLHEKVEFYEAAKILADHCGIDIPLPSDKTKPGEKEKLYQIALEGERQFSKVLQSSEKGSKARNYLKKRGIKAETVKTLKIGYALPTWDAITHHLTKIKGFSITNVVASGLSILKADGSAYDRFRGRIIFPIKNLTGKTVGFGGRTLKETEEAKYINSPESPIYSKSYNLYGLNLSKNDIREEGYAVLVEGYLDFIALYESGIKNVIASLGTSLTTGHVGLIKRFTDTVVFNYDPDSAGKAATLRSLDLLLSRDMKTKIMTLPEGKDPDQFIREKGVEAYKKCIEEAKPYMEYLIEEASKEKDLRDPSVQVSVLNEILPHLAVIESPVARNQYIPILSDALKIEDELLLEELKRMLKKRKDSVSTGREAGAALKEAEARLIALILDLEEGREDLIAQLNSEDFSNPHASKIVSTIVELNSEQKLINYATVGQELKDESSKKILRSIAFGLQPESQISDATDFLETMRLGRLKRERTKIQREMEKTKNPSKLSLLMKRKMDISKQIDLLS
jgi:DNA primase